jgi:hypothetical protein
MYKRIDIHAGPLLAEGTLERTSLCPCGNPFMSNHVVRGMRYNVDLKSVRWARFECHGCGKEFEVRLIDVWDEITQRPYWFPLDLLDLDRAIPFLPKPEKWQKVENNQVPPKQKNPRVIVQ